MAQIGEPIRRHEVIPIHTPPVETPPEPRAPVVEPQQQPAEPEKVDYAAIRAEIFARFPKTLAYLASR